MQQTQNDIQEPNSVLSLNEEALDYYKKAFSWCSSTYIPMNKIVKLQNYENLYRSLAQIIKSKQNQIVLMYGLAGNGKKTSVLYALNEIKLQSKQDIKIFNFDARIQNTEKIFVERFFSLLQSNQIIEYHTCPISKLQNFLFSEVDDILKAYKIPIIIQIENMCEWSQDKRQVILYSLLDWIRSSNVSIILIGLINDLTFFDKLEKRVKSRLSYISFNFFQLQLKELEQILTLRMNGSPSPVIDKKLSLIIQNKEIQEFVKMHYLGQRTIKWFVNLFKLAFLMINPNDLTQAKLPSIFHNLLLRAKLMLEPLNEPIILEELLITPELMLLIILKRLIEQERYPIMFEHLEEEISYLNKRHNTFQMIIFTKSMIKHSIGILISIGLISEIKSRMKLDNPEYILHVNINDLNQFLRNNEEYLPSYLISWYREF